MNSREQNYRAKQEGYPSDSKVSKTPSTSRQWASFRNPRIVRVSRTFGGKDRHSKVCTVRGLRDRRIRLSVPTAIQLYDLQDRLGLSQPSKVVDWLLDATKTEIDKLPPLQMPPGNFSQFFQPLAVSHQQSTSSQSSFPHFLNASPSSFMKEAGGAIKINDQTVMERSKFWIPDAAAINRKGTGRETVGEKDKWIASNEQENQEDLAGYAAQIQAQNFFPIGNQPSNFPSLLNNTLPYNPYYHLEPANLSLSQFGNHSFPIQSEADHHSHMNYSSSSMAVPSGSQLYLYPSAAALPTMIPPLPPPYMPPTVESVDPRQINHFQFLSSSSQDVLPNPLMPTLHLISSPMKSLALNVNPKILHSQERHNNEQEKEGTGS